MKTYTVWCETCQVDFYVTYEGHARVVGLDTSDQAHLDNDHDIGAGGWEHV